MSGLKRVVNDLITKDGVHLFECLPLGLGETSSGGQLDLRGDIIEGTLTRRLR